MPKTKHESTPFGVFGAALEIRRAPNNGFEYDKAKAAIQYDLKFKLWRLNKRMLNPWLLLHASGKKFLPFYK